MSPVAFDIDDGLPFPRRYLATAAILSAVVLVVLDGAIANVALPTISATLRVTPAASVWVVTSYQIALVMMLLPCAAAGESRGYRRVFSAGVVLFTLASAGCALSPNLKFLVAARFVQGLGGAAVMAPIAALLRFTYPHARLGAAIGWNAVTVALASAAGPIIGAGIVSVAAWPWLFAVNIPVGIVVLLVGRSLPRTQGSGHRLDLISVVLNAAVFAPLVLGVDQMTQSWQIGAGLLTMAGVSLVLLVRREMGVKAPLIPLDLLRTQPFRISVMASVCCFAAQMSSFIALPFYLQHGLGQSTLMTGLYMTPWALAVAAAAPMAGRLADRVKTAWLCAGGGACLALGLALAALWPLEHNLPALIAFTVLGGLGFGFFQTPNNRNMLLSASRERSGAAGGMQSMARLTGQTLGSVMMGLLFTLLPAAVAPRAALGLGALLAVVAGLLSTRRAHDV